MGNSPRVLPSGKLGAVHNDISGITGLLSNAAGGFDPSLDINAIRIVAIRSSGVPFVINTAPPLGDLWLGFRYVSPNGDGQSITESNASFLEFYDAAQNLVAQIQPVAATDRYHAVARGDTAVQGTSIYLAGSGLVQWMDVRIAVGAQITVDFYVDGVLQSSASAPNTAGKGKPVQIVFANIGLHGTIVTRTWYYAHIAVLDGVSTIGRRFVRRTPASIATFNQMAGAIEALRDEDPSTRVAASAVGQRLSFTLGGLTGPAANTAIAAVHVKQLTQGGTMGPTNTAGFLRIGSANFDAPAQAAPPLAPRPIYSTWAQNPSSNALWTSATLPTEVGILSA